MLRIQWWRLEYAFVFVGSVPLPEQSYGGNTWSNVMTSEWAVQQQSQWWPPSVQMAVFSVGVSVGGCEEDLVQRGNARKKIQQEKFVHRGEQLM